MFIGRENLQRYVEYAHSPDNAWESVERGILDYCFGRFFKDTYRCDPGWPKIVTKFGSVIPWNFSALDLGCGTGRVAKRLIEYGVRPENILGVDKNGQILEDQHFPDGVQKIRADIINLAPALKENHYPPASFNFVACNMVFHLLNYEDYVISLSQVREYMLDYKSLLLIVVPHPFRPPTIKTIGEYHQTDKPISEIAPWGERIDLQPKTIQDYERGMCEAGLNPIYMGTTGVGLKVDDRLMSVDERVWLTIKGLRSDNSFKGLPHYFRLWYLAQPE